MDNIDMEMDKKHFIFVHGAGHGAWCWYKVCTLLKSAGHKITAIDLAASGTDARKIDEVSSFAEYSQPLFDAMSSLPDSEKVILVGHSLGGLNIALAMERFPEKIAVAVFVSAFMPTHTSSPSLPLQESVQRTSANAWLDTKVEFGNGITKPPTSLLFGPQFMSSKLYQLCCPEDQMLGMILLRVAPFCLQDLFDTSLLSENRYGVVPTTYIVCGQDLAIPMQFQHWMIDNNSREVMVKELKKSDHMPMLSVPQEFCHCLLDIAKLYK